MKNILFTKKSRNRVGTNYTSWTYNLYQVVNGNVIHLGKMNGDYSDHQQNIKVQLYKKQFGNYPSLSSNEWKQFCRDVKVVEIQLPTRNTKTFS